MGQTATTYRPTAKERALLDVLLNPDCRYKTVTEICVIAECDRKTYYRAMEKPEFLAHYKAEAAALASRHVGQVMNTFVREAERGSFQHGKVVLEMAGVYTEKVKVEDVTPLADKLALARARAAEAVKHGETAD